MNITSDHRGADWLRSAGITKISPLGTRVANLLGHLFKGLYHIDTEAIKADWSSDHHIKVSFAGELATWDANQLTELVVMAHDAAIRVSVRPYGPRNLLLLFHPRKRNGGTFERHPSLEDHVSQLRSHYTVNDL